MSQAMAYFLLMRMTGGLLNEAAERKAQRRDKVAAVFRSESSNAPQKTYEALNAVRKRPAPAAAHGYSDFLDCSQLNYC